MVCVDDKIGKDATRETGSYDKRTASFDKAVKI